MRKKISQAEALRLRKRVAQLERRQEMLVRRYCSDYPGVHVRTFEPNDASFAALDTASRLGFALVGKLDMRNELRIYAVKSDA